MSDTLRTYTPNPHSGRRRIRRAAWVARIVAVALVATLLWLWWITRDNHQVHELVPNEQSYRVLVADFLEKRTRLAQSPLWDVAPEGIALADFRTQLQSDLGLPEWVINNLAYGTVQFSGDDYENFSDGLFVSRMTRTGTLIERLLTWSGRIERDDAGGLALRRVPEIGLYYAVRGRILLASPSRRTLIHALTLSPEEAVPEEVFARAVDAAREEDFYARLRPPAESAVADYFDTVRISLRTAPTGVRLSMRARLTDSFRAQAAPLLAPLRPAELTMPPAGLVGISANLGQDIRGLWRNSAAAVGAQDTWGAWWAAWQEPGPQGQPTLASVLTLLAGPLGPDLRLAWRGFDLNAMLPMPIFAAALETDPSFSDEQLLKLPPPPEGTPAWEAYPRLDAETRQLVLPLFGGPALEPTARLEGRTLLIGSGREVAQELFSAPPPVKPLGVTGNLYVQCRPTPMLEAISACGTLLAENRMLLGETPRSLKERLTPWHTAAGALEEIWLVASYEDEELVVQMNLTLKPGAAAAAPAPASETEPAR